MATNHLFRLPAELRNRIYEYALHCDKHVVPSQPSRRHRRFRSFDHNPGPSVPLLRTCKQIYREAIGIFRTSSSTVSIIMYGMFHLETLGPGVPATDSDLLLRPLKTDMSVLQYFENMRCPLPEIKNIRIEFVFPDELRLPATNRFFYALVSLLNSSAAPDVTVMIHCFAVDARGSVFRTQVNNVLWPFQKLQPRQKLRLNPMPRALKGSKRKLRRSGPQWTTKYEITDDDTNDDPTSDYVSWYLELSAKASVATTPSKDDDELSTALRKSLANCYAEARWLLLSKLAVDQRFHDVAMVCLKGMEGLLGVLRIEGGQEEERKEACRDLLRKCSTVGDRELEPERPATRYTEADRDFDPERQTTRYTDEERMAIRFPGLKKLVESE